MTISGTNATIRVLSKLRGGQAGKCGGWRIRREREIVFLEN
jgi:hypothetical protein